MPSALKHYQQAHQLHYIAFTCLSRCLYGASARLEKLHYIHENPVKRGLVEKPEDWRWSSFRHYATGEVSVVEIESQWTARKRERLGIYPTLRRRQSA